MSKYIKIQKTRVIQRRKDYSLGEHSPYWDHVGTADDSTNPENRSYEPVEANPDILAEMKNSGPSTPQLIMGEAVEHLQGRQKAVYLSTMRDDKSLEETAQLLGIKKGSVQKYKERAIKFIETWCKQAMLRGRV